MTARIYDPTKQCHGKVRHQTRRDAKRMIRQRYAGDKMLRAYPCVWCGFFHVGHRRKEAA